MKIRILRPMVVLGQPRAIGDVVDGVQANLANYLIAIRKAAPVAEKDAGKASERQTATAPKPAAAEGKAAPVAEKDAGKASERQTATAPKPAAAEGKAT